MKYFSFQWHITNKCDQRCKHCYIYSTDTCMVREMTIQEMISVVDSCIELCHVLNRKPYFVITGGDPILHDNFWELLEFLYEKNIPFGILGNPFHLSKDVCKRMNELGCRKYQMSLDGVKETHDRIRKCGSYDETIKKIAVLHECGISCAIMTTISKMNYLELPQLIDVVVQNKVDVFSFARYCPSTKENDIQQISAMEYRNLLEECWERYMIYKDSGTIFKLKDHLWKLLLYEKGLFTIPNSLDINKIYEGCNCAINHLTLLPDGTVYACRRMETPVGNVLDESIKSIYFNTKMDSFRHFEKFEKCYKCELLRFCRGCPATAYANCDGNFYAPDPQCWKIIN